MRRIEGQYRPATMNAARPCNRLDSPARSLVLDPMALLTLLAMILALGTTIRFAPDFPARHMSDNPPAPKNLQPQIQDFAFLLNYARGQFADRTRSPYAIETHERFMARWLGEKKDWAMCFGWSPMAVPVMAPLFGLPTPFAWGAFCAFSSLLFLLVSNRFASGSRDARLALRLAAASPCAVFIIGNGQTSLLTTAALLAGMSLLHRGRHDLKIDVALGIGIGLLAFKPPIAILAGVATLACGRFRPIWIGVALVAIVVGFTTIWFGPPWIHDYLALLRGYDTDSADPVFRAGFVPLIMSNLRSVLLVAGLTDALAARLSSMAFLASAGAIAVLPLLARRHLSPPMAAGFAVMAYCLFAPHLSPSEDLAMLIPAWIALGGPTRRRNHVHAILGCILVFFFGGATSWLIPGVFPRAFFPLIGFAGKLLVMAGFANPMLGAADNAPATSAPGKTA